MSTILARRRRLTGNAEVMALVRVHRVAVAGRLAPVVQARAGLWSERRRSD